LCECGWYLVGVVCVVLWLGVVLFCHVCLCCFLCVGWLCSDVGVCVFLCFGVVFGCCGGFGCVYVLRCLEVCCVGCGVIVVWVCGIECLS
jgi:hypothetical protein